MKSLISRLPVKETRIVRHEGTMDVVQFVLDDRLSDTLTKKKPTDPGYELVLEIKIKHTTYDSTPGETVCDKMTKHRILNPVNDPLHAPSVMPRARIIKVPPRRGLSLEPRVEIESEVKKVGDGEKAPGGDGVKVPEGEVKNEA